MIIDCDSCELRALACGDCVVTMLLGGPPELMEEDRQALAVLADSGLVPPLRLTVVPDAPTSLGMPGLREGAAPGVAVRRVG